MIRRGLQVVFLCGITFLGAAPCFAQYTKFPATGIFIQDLAWINGADPNGYYVNVGAQQDISTYTFRRYNTSPANAFSAVIIFDKPGQFYPTGQWVFRLDNAAQTANYGTKVLGTGTNFPVTQTSYREGTVIFREPTMEELIGGEFPDWKSASVVMPLGFSFAMAFWASAVALSVAMKWVRDLASAAT